MRVRPSDSRKVIWAVARRVGGGGGDVGGKVRKTKVEGWRAVVRVARRWGREVEPGEGDIFRCWFCVGVFCRELCVAGERMFWVLWI